MDKEIGLHSSADEINEARILAYVMLESLDQGDDTYESQKTDLESKYRYCEHLLHIKANTATPSSRQTQSGSTSASLPSRSRPSIPRWGPREPSPSDRMVPEGTLDPRNLSLGGHPEESSAGPKKRARPGSIVAHTTEGSSKHPRTTQTDRPQTSSTTKSFDSLEDDTLGLGDQHTGFTDDVFETYKRRAKQEEDRWRREQQDAALARQLSEQEHSLYRDPAQANGSTSQSFTTPGGMYARPTLSSANSWQSSQHNHGFQDSYQSSAPPNRSGHLHPQIPSTASRATSVGTYHSLPSYNSDASQFINPGQYGQSPSSFVPENPQNHFYGGSNYGQMPGSFPQSPDDFNYWGNYTHPQSSDFAAANGATLPTMGLDYHGQGGSSVFGQEQVYNSSSTQGKGPSFVLDLDNMLQDLQSRDMGYLLADPSKTKEDIIKLLDNIRPDEELPPELRQGGPKELKISLMEHQKLGLKWLKEHEESSNGSILADDMGLGKTIQALALILDRKSSNPAIKTTLIVAPVALMQQWQKEIRSKVHSRHQLKVHIYHGQGQKKDYSSLAQCDVVLTTYGTLAQEWKRLAAYHKNVIEKSEEAVPRTECKLLGENVRWYRVILDEGQAIKNRNALCSLAAQKLVADYRLIMTGTPMMNNVEELFPLIRFLRIPPYNQLPEFRQTFKALYKKDSNKMEIPDKYRTTAMERLQILLKTILLRRMKTSKIDGKPILNLKDRIVQETHATFDEEQQAFYTSLEQKTQLQFNRYLKAGQIGKHYSQILVLLLRMRQACDHPHLIENHGISSEIDTEIGEEYAGKLGEGVIARIKGANGAFECPICYDGSENPTIFFPCGHDVCAECFGRIIDPSVAVRNGEESANPKCPECRESIDPGKILNYNIFKKVHMPDVYRAEFPNDANESQLDNGPDSDSSSDDDDADDVDENGDLADFVVADDDESDGDGQPYRSNTRPPASAGKGKSKKSRQKRKGKKAVKKMTIAQLKKESLRNAAAKKKYLNRLRKNFVSSAKIDKIMELLRSIRENNPVEKTIVFSQFTSFLDLVEVPLSDTNWKWERYDGSMSAKSRSKAVDTLSEDPNCNIMLISLKAGNAGLNLNCASQVILLDPFWNPFVEEQAIDRAHRIGQMRDVHVHRVLIENTVEDRILALQEKKRDVINNALDEDKAKNLSRLGREELIFLFNSGET